MSLYLSFPHSAGLAGFPPATRQCFTRGENELGLGEPLGIWHLLTVIVPANQCLMGGIEEVIQTQDLNEMVICCVL
jgi:hypothetical protein